MAIPLVSMTGGSNIGEKIKLDKSKNVSDPKFTSRRERKSMWRAEKAFMSYKSVTSNLKRYKLGIQITIT